MKITGKKVAWSIFILVLITGIFLYHNFNKLLSEALLRSYNSNTASDVYELRFEKLQVNFFEGSIRVSNVLIQPREKPLRSYPYINSSFRLKAEKLMLINVQLFELLNSNTLNLERISIIKPDITLTLVGHNPVLFPFKDSTAFVDQPKETHKKFLESFSLKEFQLVDASFHVTNSGKARQFSIQKFNISLEDLLIRQLPGKGVTSFKHVALSVGEFSGKFQKGPFSRVSLKDYTLKIDSLEIAKTIDTVMYKFDDLTVSLRNLDSQTADSIFHITLQSFNLSYRNKSIHLRKLTAKPNVSELELQKKFTYQQAQFSGSVGSLELVNVNFDSLVHHRNILIDAIVLDSVSASVFKDKIKPLDKNRFPVYLGQTIKGIPLPVRINRVKATNVNLVSVERKPDSTYAKAILERATLEVKNITNLSNGSLVLNADAYLEGKAHFTASLRFDYTKPQFHFEGKVKRFTLTDINRLITDYTPARFNSGILDELSFSGLADQTKATGTMKFLYHDLDVDLKLKERAKWTSAVITFAANSILDSSNPPEADLPPRIVQFEVKRDLNKGFVNIVIKSLLTGLKETMLMSKKNRKAYQQSKKKSKQSK